MMASDSPGSGAEAANDSRPVDLDHLRRYTLGDRDLEVEILGLFADQLPITIGALNEAASMKEWGIAAHTLKGSARAVGAWSLATLAETAEKLHHLPDASERRKVVVQVEEAAGVASDYIASLAHAA
jgi:HPt (histidine-containing phosphotransfer) domain-containing protein